MTKDTASEQIVRAMIRSIGDDPDREDLRETPGRVVRSWGEIFAGYREPEPRLKWFENGSSEMIIVRGISIWSMCEHHMLPFFGEVDVAYLPGGHVIGISKIPRLVNWRSRRLQIQERLAVEIVEALHREDVRGVAVSIRSQHLCLLMRGVREANATMVTNYMSGEFQTDPAVRAEFLQGVKP